MPVIGSTTPPSAPGNSLEQLIYSMNSTLGAFSREVGELSVSTDRLSDKVDNLGDQIELLSDNLTKMSISGDTSGLGVNTSTTRQINGAVLDPASVSILATLRAMETIDAKKLSTWKIIPVNMLAGVIEKMAGALAKVGTFDTEKMRNGALAVNTLTQSLKDMNASIPLMAIGIGSMVMLTRYASAEEIAIGAGIATGMLLAQSGILIALSHLAGKKGEDALTDGAKAMLYVSGSTALMSLAVLASAKMFETIGGFDMDKVKSGGILAGEIVGFTSLVFLGLGKLMKSHEVISALIGVAGVAASIYAFGAVTKYWGETALWMHENKEAVTSGSLVMGTIVGSISALIGGIGALSTLSGGIGALVIAGGELLLAGVFGVIHYASTSMLSYGKSMMQLDEIDKGLKSVGGISGMSSRMTGWLAGFYKDFAGIAGEVASLGNMVAISRFADGLIGSKGILKVASNFLDVIDKMFNMKILVGFENGSFYNKPKYKSLSMAWNEMPNAGGVLGRAISGFAFALYNGLKDVNSKEFLDKTADISNALMGEFKFGFGHAGALSMAGKFLDVINQLGNMKIIASIDEYGNTKYKPLSLNMGKMGELGAQLGNGIGSFVKEMAKHLSADLKQEADNMKYIAQAMVGDSWSLSSLIAGKDAGLLPVITGIVDIIQRIASGKFITYDKEGNPKQVIEAKVKDFAGTGIELAKGIGGFIRGLANNLKDDIDGVDFGKLIKRMGKVGEVLGDEDDGIISIVERIGRVGAKASWNAFVRFRDMAMSVFSTISSTAHLFSEARKNLYDDIEDVVDDMDDTIGYFGKIVKKVEKFGDLDTFKSTLYAKHTMGGLKELLNDTFKTFGEKHTSEQLNGLIMNSKETLKAIAGETDGWWAGKTDGLIDVMIRAVVKTEKLSAREEVTFKNGTQFKIAQAIEHLDQALMKNAGEREKTLDKLTKKLNDAAKAMANLSESADKLGGLDKIGNLSGVAMSDGKNHASSQNGRNVTNVNIPSTMVVRLDNASIGAINEAIRNNIILILSEK